MRKMSLETMGEDLNNKVIAITFLTGGFFVWVKSKVAELQAKNEETNKRLDEIQKTLTEVRENWVTRPYLRTELKDMEARLITNISLAVSGKLRRGSDPVIPHEKE